MKQIERSVFKTLIIKWWNFNKSYINNDLIRFLKKKKTMIWYALYILYAWLLNLSHFLFTFYLILRAHFNLEKTLGQELA